MISKILDHCSDMPLWKVLLMGVVLGLAIELFTVWVRFGLGLQSTRDTGWVASLTFGLRIHHGYIGVVLILVGLAVFHDNSGAQNLLLMVGIALAFSDLIHHFLVLWPITGSPQFDFFYPTSVDSG